MGLKTNLCRLAMDAGKPQLLRSQRRAEVAPDVTTHAGVAKILFQDDDKLHSLFLKETKRLKEESFMRRIHRNVEEQTRSLKIQVHRGQDPVTVETRRQILKQRVFLLQGNGIKWGAVQREGDSDGGKSKLHSRRLLYEPGPTSEGAPFFHLHSSFNLELRLRLLRLFQQAARKVVMQCRVRRRLAALKKLQKNLAVVKKEKTETETQSDAISPDKVHPFQFPIFCSKSDLLSHSDVLALSVDPVDMSVETSVPFLKLQVAQHSDLMGYQPVSILKALDSCSPTSLTRPLRTGSLEGSEDQEEPRAEEKPQPETVDEAVETLWSTTLSFTAPAALLTPGPVNPLRVFNPAPGLQAHKPRPRYMEGDVEVHVCPRSSYSVSDSKTTDKRTQVGQHNLLDRHEVIKGIMSWKNFDSFFSKSLSEAPENRVVPWNVDYDADVLPLTAPSPLTAKDVTPTVDFDVEVPGIQLTPEMIRAEFLSSRLLTLR